MLTMAMTRSRARDLLARLEPAQVRILELLADGATLGDIAGRFNNCREAVISRQLTMAREVCRVRTNADLVDVYLAAQGYKV